LHNNILKKLGQTFYMFWFLNNNISLIHWNGGRNNVDKKLYIFVGGFSKPREQLFFKLNGVFSQLLKIYFLNSIYQYMNYLLKIENEMVNEKW
jgi:hypothetical protein